MPYVGNMNTTFTTLTSSDANITDDLTVTDDASVGGDLTVTGTTTVTGNVGIGQAAHGTYALVIEDADGFNIRIENDDEVNFIRTLDNGDFFFMAHGSQNIQFYNGTGSGTEVMNIDSSGAMTKPLQPAFLAKIASQIDNITVGGVSNTTIAFGTEVFDQNADFASNTFTAPVAGRYQLSFFLRLENVDTAATSYQFLISTSNRNYVHLIHPSTTFTSDSTYVHANLSILADMDASDTATVQYYQDGGTAQTDIDTDSYFSGFLAC